MSPKHRIAVIRLSDKLGKNPQYAKMIGVSVEYRKADDVSNTVDEEKDRKLYDVQA